jgi:hypothetical protein
VAVNDRDAAVADFGSIGSGERSFVQSGHSLPARQASPEFSGDDGPGRRVRGGTAIWLFLVIKIQVTTSDWIDLLCTFGGRSYCRARLNDTL